MKNKKDLYPIYFLKNFHLFSYKIQALFGLNKPAQNKPMETVPTVSNKYPPQMGQTHGAKTHAPGIATEPGKLG